MINFDFLQFDQINLWFAVFSGIGLIRERRLLPFFIVAIGNLMHGTLAAALLAGLILWHRIDVPAPKWVQLKDALALIFVFIAAVSPDPLQSFCIGIGVLFLSFSFGRGELGIIPVLLMLRQYVPHPPELEVLMGVAGIYWITDEVIRYVKFEQKVMARAIVETLCGLGILYGLKDVAIKWIDDPILISVGAGLAVIVLMLTLLVRLRGGRFWAFYRKSKIKLANSLTFGNRFIGASVPWPTEPAEKSFLAIEESFDRLFVLTLVIAALLGVVFVISRGGIT